MADAIVRNESPGTEDSAVSAVSWAAIIAGGLSSAAVTLVLLAFGAGLGFSSVSPWQNSGVSATTLGRRSFSDAAHRPARQTWTRRCHRPENERGIPSGSSMRKRKSQMQI